MDYPKKLVFEFDEIRLVKEKKLFSGEKITITLNPKWRNAMKPPPEGFDWNPKTVEITEKDFEEIWNEMKKIDFKRISNLKESDFMSIPPDVQGGEGIIIKIDSKISIECGKKDYWIREKVKEQLYPISNIIRKKFEEKTKKT